MNYIEAEAELIKKEWIRPAFYEQEIVFNGHKRTETIIERRIFREQDVPVYRVAVPQEIKFVECSELKENVIDLKYIEYVPTGKIIYDNTRPSGMIPVLFEYVLKNARSLQK